MHPFPAIAFTGALLLAPALSATAGSPPAAGTTVATLSKAIADVTRKEPDREWQKAKMGELLNTGDRLKTGERSVAIIKFKDNSLVRVREESEVIVTGTMSGNAFSKSVTIDQGGLGFNVAKQRAGEEFRFTSPTSVASIRGTGGEFITSHDGDTLIVLNGTITFSNNASSRSLDIGAGYTGISQPDGNLLSRLATDDEKKSAEDAIRTGDQPMKLEFELRDGQGRTKNLRIDYKQ